MCNGALGYEGHECDTEDEARARVEELARSGKWPCHFFRSDTTGEKDFEEFTTESDVLDLERFKSVGVIRNAPGADTHLLNKFTAEIDRMRASRTWTKEELVELFQEMVPEFLHKERNKNLDGRM